jgi:hypothetical protein
MDWSERVKSLWFKKPKEKTFLTKVCQNCKKEFQLSEQNKKSIFRKYCSIECSGFVSRKTKRPSKEQILKDLETMSFCSVGRKYGVSDNAIRKWIKVM